MNKKSLVKYRHGNDTGFMHYVIFQKEVVVLSEEATRKVKYISEKGALDVSFDVDSDQYDVLKAEVITDPKYVEQVYTYMIETNNAYFRDGFDGLCVIKLSK